MNPEMLEEVNRIVDQKIKEHEVKAGRTSGLIGLVVALGIIHSIWLIKSAM